MLSVCELGAEAIAYIRHQLSGGGDLATQMLSLPLEAGKIVSYLPAGLTTEIALDFGESVFLSSGLAITGVDDELASFTSAFLTTQDERYAVFETYAKADSPWPPMKVLPYFICDTSVYLFQASRSFTYDQILDAMTRARTYPFVCGLTSLPPGLPAVEPAEEVPMEILEKFAARTEHAIIGAYDGEGYLIWSRR